MADLGSGRMSGLCLQCGPKQTLVRALSIGVRCPLVLLFTQVSRARSPTACVLMRSRSGRTIHLRGASGRSATRARVHHNLADCLRCMVGRLWYFLIWFRCTAFGGGDHRSPPLRLPSAFGGR